MTDIKYYVLKTENNTYLGKCGKLLNIGINNFDWWDVKEYAFLDKGQANAKAKRYNETHRPNTYMTFETSIVFDNKEEKKIFIERFIKPYYKNTKLINKLLKECE